MLRRVTFYHSLLWAKYKGLVFSRVHEHSGSREILASFVQVAETERKRTGLGGIDLSYHQYPFRLLFHGLYERVPLPRRMLALARDLIRHPCELVVLPGYDRTEYWMMLIICILLGRKRAVFCESTIHDRTRSSWKEFAKRAFFRRCDGYFCYGIRSKDYIVHYGIDEKRVNYPCQATALPHSYNADDVLREYTAKGFDATSPQFLYVGRLSAEKGLDDLLDAFHLVRLSIPNATLVLIGAGTLKQQLITRAKHLGLAQSVTFLGPKKLEEIAVHFMQSVALVLPSHSEPWGLVVNESLSYGCPVVVSDICGCVPELVVPGVTGFSFEARNVRALSESMLSVLHFASDRLGAAKNCIERVSLFGPDRAAYEILEGCNRILDGAS